jgi:hypothetical protein
VGIISTYASGYSAYYVRDRDRHCPYIARGGCNENEIRALEHQGEMTFDPQNPDQCWWPRSEDFQVEARKHGNATGVGSMAALVQLIRQQRNLNLVLWFGHGASGELQFGSRQVLNASGISSLPDLSAHFAANGMIDFYACNAGNSQGFFQSMANRLRVKVRGFATGVRWNLSWEGTSPHRLVTSRGISGALPMPGITCIPK